MNTHEVTLNGRPLAIGLHYHKLVTTLRSFEHYNDDGYRVITHDLVMDGFDASGEATQIIPLMRVHSGDVIKIVI